MLKFSLVKFVFLLSLALHYNFEILQRQYSHSPDCTLNTETQILKCDNCHGNLKNATVKSAQRYFQTAPALFWTEAF